MLNLNSGVARRLDVCKCQDCAIEVTNFTMCRDGHRIVKKAVTNLAYWPALQVPSLPKGL